MTSPLDQTPIRTFDGTSAAPAPMGVLGLDEDTFAEALPIEHGTRMDNPLDALKASITEAVRRPDISLMVLSRPGLTIRYNTNIDMELLQRWRRSAHDKTAPDNFNVLRFMSLVVVNTALAFALNGEEPVGANGQPISFASPEVAQWTGQKRVLDSVRSLFASDGNIVTCGQQILDAAGYGDESMEADDEVGPTRAS